MIKRRSRVDRLTTGWMVLATIVVLLTIIGRGVIPASWWLSIHVITLGVLSNAILQWSWYFSRSLLRLPADDRHSGRDQILRQVLFNVVLMVLVASMITSNLIGILVGAAGIGVVLAWHGLALVIASRNHLSSRFAVVIRYYIVAAAFFVLGCLYAGLIAVTMYGVNVSTWLVSARSGLTLAHALVNGLGWIGLSIAGTLVTLWPTVLHTRIPHDVTVQAVRALPISAVSLLTAAICATSSLTLPAGLALLFFGASLIWGVGLPLVREAISRRPRDYAGWSMSAGIVWLLVGLTVLAFQLCFSQTPDRFRQIAPLTIAVIGIGGVLQVFVGALTYLMPVVIGGGPQAVKAGIFEINKMGTTRLVIKNGALVCAVFSPVTPAVFWMVVLACAIADLYAFGITGVVQARTKRGAAAPKLPMTGEKT